MLQPLYSQKNPIFPSNNKLCGLQSYLGQCDYAVFIIYYWSLYSGMYSTSSCSAKYDWQKLNCCLSIDSGNKHRKAWMIAMWLPFQSSWWCINSRFVVQCKAMIYRVRHNSFYTYTVFVRNIPQTKLLHVFAYKVKHVNTSQQACERLFLTLS